MVALPLRLFLARLAGNRFAGAVSRAKRPASPFNVQSALGRKPTIHQSLKGRENQLP